MHEGESGQSGNGVRSLLLVLESSSRSKGDGLRLICIAGESMAANSECRGTIRQRTQNYGLSAQPLRRLQRCLEEDLGFSLDQLPDMRFWTLTEQDIAAARLSKMAAAAVIRFIGTVTCQ